MALPRTLITELGVVEVGLRETFTAIDVGMGPRLSTINEWSHSSQDDQFPP